MKKFRVYDLYEGYGSIGEFDTLTDARNAVSSWMDETDGECDPVILKWDDAVQAYRAVISPKGA